MGTTTSNETLCTTQPDANGSSYWAKFENRPFAEGSCRFAFKGTLIGDGPRDNTTCVVKLFKQPYKRGLYSNNVDLRIAELARKYAAAYNLETGHVTKDIVFNVPLVAKMDNIGKFKLFGFIPFADTVCGKRDYVSIEEFIDGYYEKFNSNGGWTDETAELVQAFSHYTWIKSGKAHVICDLQGVSSSNEYILTDPAIHSKTKTTGLFGNTDMGIVGVYTFFKTHNCNKYCSKYERPNLSKLNLKEFPTLPRRKATSYSFNSSSTLESYTETNLEILYDVLNRTNMEAIEEED